VWIMKFAVTALPYTDPVVSWATHACSVERKPVVYLVQTWKQLRWASRSYKRLQILRFYWSNTGLDTGILQERFTGAIQRTNFPWRSLWRYCYGKFHLVAPRICTDSGPVGPGPRSQSDAVKAWLIPPTLASVAKTRQYVQAEGNWGDMESDEDSACTSNGSSDS